MKKRLFLLPIMFLIIVLASCSPIDKKYNENSMKMDLTQLVLRGDLDTADIPYLTMYIMKVPITGVLDTMTYRQLLDSAQAMKAYVAQKKQEAKEMASSNSESSASNK